MKVHDEFKSSFSVRKIYGDIDIFQVQNVITEVINRMTEGQHENVKLQISLQNTLNNRIIETKLMSEHAVIEKRWIG